MYSYCLTFFILADDDKILWYENTLPTAFSPTFTKSVISTNIDEPEEEQLDEQTKIDLQEEEDAIDIDTDNEDHLQPNEV